MASIISEFKRKLASILTLPSAKRELERTALVGEVGSQSNERDGRPHKRQRRSMLDDDDGGTAAATPYLLSESARCPPRHRSSSALLKSANVAVSNDYHYFGNNSSSSSAPQLTHLPNDILSHCLYFIHTRSDRFGLQVSCKTLYQASNTDKMLAHLDLGGDVTAIAHQRGANNFYGELDEDTTAGVLDNDDGDGADGQDAFVVVRRLQMLRHRGNIIGGNDDEENLDENVGEDGGGGRLHVNHVVAGAAAAAVSQSTKSPLHPKSISNGFIVDCDTSVSACTKLVKFAAAGNVQAIYMYVRLLVFIDVRVSMLDYALLFIFYLIVNFQ